jgi:ankyrin repeat protein
MILTAQVSCEDESLSVLRQFFYDQSHLNVFNFPDLLSAYLDLSGKTFGSILSLTLRSAIDQVDVNGRTTLSWAAQKGDSEIVIQLLGCGADPNCADAYGLRPLHWSAYAATNECMRVLLAAKAEIDAKENCGRTALAYAVELSDDVSFTELLLSHGADIESQDKSGDRILPCAVWWNRSTQVSVLLENGVDVNAFSLTGVTAVAHAITCNSHDALRVLLNHGDLDYECKDNDSLSLTHVAAQDGDIETLYLLQSAGLSRIDLNTKCASGYTALDWAKWRRHYNEQWACWTIQQQNEDPSQWYTAFKAFIEGIADTQRAESEGSGPAEQTREEDSSQEYSSEKGGSKDDDEPEAWYDAPEVAD